MKGGSSQLLVEIWNFFTEVSREISTYFLYKFKALPPERWKLVLKNRVRDKSYDWLAEFEGMLF
jgi:hypothetical protein